MSDKYSFSKFMNFLCCGSNSKKKKKNAHERRSQEGVDEEDIGAFINSSRGGHGAPPIMDIGGPESMRSEILSNGGGDLPYNNSDP